MTDKPERFDPTKHSHARFAIEMVPLPKPYRGGGSRLQMFEDIAALQAIPQDDSQSSVYPEKWPEDDLYAAAVALNDELFRRGRHEDAEQLARLFLGLTPPSIEAARQTLSVHDFESRGGDVWARVDCNEAISASGGKVWVDSEEGIPSDALRALATVADHTKAEADEEVDA